MNLNFDRQFELRRAFDCFAKNFCLDLDLMFVTRMLVLAAAAPAKIRAARLNPMERWFNDGFDCGAGESRFLLRDRGLDLFTAQHEGDENRFAASAGVGGQARKSVAAVDQLFNGEEQAAILTDGL